MDEDDESAALHQLELENEQWQEMLRADPDYEKWLNQLENEYAVFKGYQEAI